MLKLASGKLKGPYPTSDILRLIREGTFEGHESITKYPGDGRWNSISAHSDFYDALLGQLSNDDAKSASLDLITDDEQATVYGLPPEPIVITPPKKVVIETPKVEKPQPQTIDLTPETIELNELKKIKFTETIKKEISFNKTPLLAVIFLALAGVGLLLWPDSEIQDGHHHLVIPKPTERKISTEQAKSLFQKGVAHVFRDTLPDYLVAQEIFSEILSSLPNEIQSRGLLCLTHHNLWPFVKQDNSDLNALRYMVKSTASLAPTSAEAGICQVTDLLAGGRLKEAQSLIDKGLKEFPEQAVFYFYKAEVAFQMRKLQDSIDWYEKIPKLWPNYLKPYVYIGLSYEQLNDLGLARKYYEAALQKFPQQPSALTLLGSMQIRLVGEIDQGFTHLKLGMKDPPSLPRVLQARGYLAFAQYYNRNGDPASALTNAKKAYQIDPGWTEAREMTLQLGGSSELAKRQGSDDELVFIGDQHKRMGNCFAAQAEYKVAFEKDPKNAIAALKAAKCLWEISQAKEAIDWARKAINADPKFTESYLTLSDFYSQRFDYLNAARALKQGADYGESKFEILKGYALLELRREDPAKAMTFGQKALKLYDKDVDLFIILAKTNILSRDYKNAFSFAARAVDLDPNLAEAHVLFAKSKVALNGLQSGVEYLRERERNFHYVIDYKLGLGEIFYEDDQFTAAEDYFLEAIAIDAKNKRAYLWLAKTYQRQGKLTDAYEQYLTAATMDPSDAEPLFYAALLEIERLEPDRAISQLKRVIKTNPFYPLANYYIGKAALLKRPPDGGLALESADKERRVNPNLADAYLLAAEAHYISGKFSACATEYQKAVRLRSQGAQIYVKMAQCYRKSGNLDAAEAMLDVASDRESGLPNIFLERGAIFEAQGDGNAAIQSYEQYLTLSPNAEDRFEVKKRIEQLGGSVNPEAPDEGG